MPDSAKCHQCEGKTSFVFIMEKDDERKDVCRACKDKLDKEGWTVTGSMLF